MATPNPALAYAIFPLVVLLMLLTSGRETMMAFKGYAAILIWIQLWPPLYAILNGLGLRRLRPHLP
jgi:conjugal transfer mating pair stabilization protein TraG